MTFPDVKFLRLLTIAFVCATFHAAGATEAARFDSASYLTLTSSQSLEEHIPIIPPAPIPVVGYVEKPPGGGPFPAVIVLHGCAGLGTLSDPGLNANDWPDMLVSWGYAVLVVDSFTPRGISDTCHTDARYYRLQDAFGALKFFSAKPYVDATRVALLGFSAGGIATLEALKRRDFQLFDIPAGLDFRAGAAFYPCFGSRLDSPKPILILNGDADDWSKRSVCEAMMNARPQSATSIRLVSYANAYHGFDRRQMRPGRMGFGHWLEYNEEAAIQAFGEVRRFLDQSLKE